MSRRPLVAVLGLSLISSFVAGSCKEEEAEQFGFACVELVQGEDQESDPFVGTAKIKLTLRYEECLRDYYTKKFPEQTIEGVEGAEVFAEWKDRLCTEKVGDPLVPCEVEEFQQTLVDAGENSIYQMTITYRVLDASAVNARTLLWGPAPLEAEAECAQNQRPFVRMALPSDVIGLDNNGATIWTASTFANPRGIIQQKTAGCIQADIARAPGA